MFKIITVILFACAWFIQYSEMAPLQILPDKEGHIPVYIRIGDTPLDEINTELAEAFHESNIRTRQTEDPKPEEPPAPQITEVEEKKPEDIADEKSEEAKAQIKRQAPEQPSKSIESDTNIADSPQEVQPQEINPVEPAAEEPKPEETRRRRQADKEQPSKHPKSDQPIDQHIDSQNHSPDSTEDSAKNPE